MGNSWVREFRDGTAQTPGSVTPQQDSKPTFDSQLGFPSGRVPRVLNVSAEEMEAVQLQPWEKNYCADHHIRHETEHCLQEDYRMRMMEYERERRLRQRAKRIAVAGGGDDEDYRMRMMEY